MNLFTTCVLTFAGILVGWYKGYCFRTCWYVACYVINRLRFAVIGKFSISHICKIPVTAYYKMLCCSKLLLIGLIKNWKSPISMLSLSD